MKHNILKALFLFLICFYITPAYALTSGTTTSGSIVAGGTSNQSFTGTAGYKPDGSYWSYGYDRFSGSLPATGTYTVVLTGFNKTDSGSYRLDYIIGGGTVSEGSLLTTQMRAGNLSANGIDSYIFSGGRKRSECNNIRFIYKGYQYL